MVGRSCDARDQASAPAAKTVWPRARRASAAPLTEAQLHDIEQLSVLAEKMGWFRFKMHECEATLPFAHMHRGRREPAPRPPTPSTAPQSSPATPNARQRRAALRLQEFQQRKRDERKGGTADAADAASPVRKKPMLQRIFEKVWSPSETQGDAPTSPPGLARTDALPSASTTAAPADAEPPAPAPAAGRFLGNQRFAKGESRFPKGRHCVTGPYSMFVAAQNAQLDGTRDPRCFIKFSPDGQRTRKVRRGGGARKHLEFEFAAADSLLNQVAVARVERHATQRRLLEAGIEVADLSGSEPSSPRPANEGVP